jgi:hypothetical protein
MRLYLHLFLACCFLFSCQRQEAALNQVKFLTLDAADRSKIPHVADFLALYPHATVRYLSFAGSDFPGLSLDTMLHDRYVLNLRLPVHYAADGTRIDRYGDPAFFLVEVESVTTTGGRLAEISYGDQQLHFGEVEWKKLLAAKGDFSVLGQTLEKVRPVPDFHLIVKEYDDLKRRP